MGRLATRRDPLGRIEFFDYDLEGHPTRWVDRKGQVTSRGYDALDRLYTITYEDGSTITYTYDDRDRVTLIGDTASGTIGRTYDDLDRLTSETTPQGSITYTYDAADRRATMTVVGQPDVVYTYDDPDRLTTITRDTLAVALAYDEANRRTSLTLPNGIVTEYGYDDADQLTSLTYLNAQTTLGNLTYTYDLAGRPNGNLTSDGLTSYAWNARNRLVGTLDAIHLPTVQVWRERMGGLPMIATHDNDLGLAARTFGVDVRGI